MRSWIARTWMLIQSAPAVLLAIVAAFFAVQAARRSIDKAIQARRIGAGIIPSTSPTELARQLDAQLDSYQKVIGHTQAAARARRAADLAASRIETAGQPSLAELVRSWNRD